LTKKFTLICLNKQFDVVAVFACLYVEPRAITEKNKLLRETELF